MRNLIVPLVLAISVVAQETPANGFLSMMPSASVSFTGSPPPFRIAFGQAGAKHRLP
jgi:hypothetical protein